MTSSNEQRELTDAQLKTLGAATGASADEAQEAYKNLWKRFPNGFLTKEEFMSKFHETELFGAKNKNIYPSKYLFDVFDQNHSGTIDLYEYLFALASIQSQNPKLLLDCLFKMCDSDSDDQLTQDEMVHALYAFFNMIAKRSDSEADNQPEFSMDEIKDSIKKAFGDKTRITKHDFREVCEKSEVMESLAKRIYTVALLSMIFDDSDFD